MKLEMVKRVKKRSKITPISYGFQLRAGYDFSISFSLRKLFAPSIEVNQNYMKHIWFIPGIQ